MKETTSFEGTSEVPTHNNHHRKGLRGLFHRGSKSSETSSSESVEKRDITPSPTSSFGPTRDGVVSTSSSWTSAGPLGKQKTGKHSDNFMVLKQPPSAREAAFHGPPRYDWIDIVSSVSCSIDVGSKSNPCQPRRGAMVIVNCSARSMYYVL